MAASEPCRFRLRLFTAFSQLCHTVKASWDTLSCVLFYLSVHRDRHILLCREVAKLHHPMSLSPPCPTGSASTDSAQLPDIPFLPPRTALFEAAVTPSASPAKHALPTPPRHRSSSAPQPNSTPYDRARSRLAYYSIDAAAPKARLENSRRLHASR
jgi:hypothetical protein